MKFYHLPVMTDEVIRFLDCESGKVYVDGTIGGGGHAFEILRATEPDGRVIGIDWDNASLEYAKRRLSPYLSRVLFIKGNFADIKWLLMEHGIKKIDGILLDLGVSSEHLERPERGFSFKHNAFLDMRMDRGRTVTAYDIINNFTTEELKKIFKRYGEERWADRIVRLIERKRREKPIETTLELAELVSSAIPRRFHPKHIHPATRVFLALRIAVNNELENIKKTINDGVEFLPPGGRMVVISFHSLEDRIVKSSFVALTGRCICPRGMPVCICNARQEVRILTRRVVIPSDEEIRSNPRARSAKLRAIERL